MWRDIADERYCVVVGLPFMQSWIEAWHSQLKWKLEYNRELANKMMRSLNQKDAIANV